MKVVQAINMLTIRQTAKRGPLSEHRLRLMEKQGRLPGIYSGNRFLINYELLLDQLNRQSAERLGEARETL